MHLESTQEDSVPFLSFEVGGEVEDLQVGPEAVSVRLGSEFTHVEPLLPGSGRGLLIFTDFVYLGAFATHLFDAHLPLLEAQLRLEQGAEKISQAPTLSSQKGKS